jgi:hypothetical protein
MGCSVDLLSDLRVGMLVIEEECSEAAPGSALSARRCGRRAGDLPPFDVKALREAGRAVTKPETE